MAFENFMHRNFLNGVSNCVKLTTNEKIICAKRMAFCYLYDNNSNR